MLPYYECTKTICIGPRFNPKATYVIKTSSGKIVKQMQFKSLVQLLTEGRYRTAPVHGMGKCSIEEKNNPENCWYFIRPSR